MGMQTESLRWFQQVADGVTVTEVSEIERVTQSGVSRALARLEDEVGTPLLRRSGRTLRMTRAGAAFKRHVDAMLHDLDDGLAAVNQLLDPETGVVSLAFQASLGTWLVPGLIGSYRREHPKVRFTLEPIGNETAPSSVGAGLVDMEISAIRRRDPSVRWRPVLVEPLLAAVPAGHRLARREGLAVADLAGEPFVGLRRTTALRRLVDGLCAAAGYEPDVAFESDDLATVQGFVAAGLGVAVVPAPRAGSPYTVEGQIAYRPLTDPRAVREVGLVWAVERRLLPAAESFRRHVIDRAAAGWLPPALGAAERPTRDESRPPY